MIEVMIGYVETLLHSDFALVSLFAVWLATFFAGENGALLSLMLAFQGYLSVEDVVLFSFLGSLSADLFWYGMTVSAIRPWVERKFKKKSPEEVEETRRSFFTIADRYPYSVLVCIKFLVGIRLILTIYIVAKKHIPFLRYVIVNVIANALFMTGLTLLAWFFSESTEYAFHAERTITHTLTLLVIVVLAGNVALRLFEHGIIRYVAWKRDRTDM